MIFYLNWMALLNVSFHVAFVNGRFHFLDKTIVDFSKLLRKEIEKFFAERDRDFDGRLSLEEFLGEETQIEKLFRLMDKNKDGFVTKKVRNGKSFLISISGKSQTFYAWNIYLTHLHEKRVLMKSFPSIGRTLAVSHELFHRLNLNIPSSYTLNPNNVETNALLNHLIMS